MALAIGGELCAPPTPAYCGGSKKKTSFWKSLKNRRYTSQKTEKHAKFCMFCQKSWSRNIVISLVFAILHLELEYENVLIHCYLQWFCARTASKHCKYQCFCLALQNTVNTSVLGCSVQTRIVSSSVLLK